MAYQNIGTPRFYIDIFQYLHAIGEIKNTSMNSFETDPLGSIWNQVGKSYTMTNDEFKYPFGLNPSYRKRFNFSDTGVDLAGASHEFQFDGDPALEAQQVDDANYAYDPRAKRGNLHIDDFDKYINYIAILGHNFKSASQEMGGDQSEGLLITPKVRAINNANIWGQLQDNSTGSVWYEEGGFKPGSFENIVGFERYQGSFQNQDWLTLSCKDLDGFSIGTFTEGLSADFAINDNGGFNNPFDSSWPSYFNITIGSENTTNFDPNFIHIPSISVGAFYDMPHSPNMSLTFKRVYDGIDQKKTRGGATLSNVRYSGPPNWKSDRSLKPWTNYIPYDHGSASNVWENNAPDVLNKSNISRNGRRVWDLSWDMIGDSDLMGAYESINTTTYDIADDVDAPDSTDGGSTSGYSNPLLNDDNFYSRVLLRTLGGKLPFIFQPDNTNNNTDQFAICTIKSKSFSFRQKAHKLYNIKLTIEETW